MTIYAKPTKIGVLWTSPKRDKRGQPFMSGIIDEDISLEKGQKIFVFQTDPARRGPRSPNANVLVEARGGKQVDQVDERGGEQEKPEEPMPEPLPDDDIPF